MSLFMSTKKLNGVPLIREANSNVQEIYEWCKDSKDEYAALFTADDAAVKLIARCTLFTGGTLHFFNAEGRDDLKSFMEQLRNIGADVVLYTSSDVFTTAAVSEHQTSERKKSAGFQPLDANVGFMKDHLTKIGTVQDNDDAFDDDEE